MKLARELAVSEMEQIVFILGVLSCVGAMMAPPAYNAWITFFALILGGAIALGNSYWYREENEEKIILEEEMLEEI